MRRLPGGMKKFRSVKRIKVTGTQEDRRQEYEVKVEENFSMTGWTQE